MFNQIKIDIIEVDNNRYRSEVFELATLRSYMRHLLHIINVTYLIYIFVKHDAGVRLVVLLVVHCALITAHDTLLTLFFLVLSSTFPFVFELLFAICISRFVWHCYC